MSSPISYDFIVSAENNYYVAWQAMVLHYTCMKQMKQAPIIVVHSNDDEELLSPFDLIRRHGGRIQQARNFRGDGGWEYPPRNTAGSLSVVQSHADYLVVCDPDMIFFRPLPLEHFVLSNNQVSYDSVSYLFVNEDNRAKLEGPSRAAGVELDPLTDRCFSGGVPHIIPRSLQEPLSRDWLECMSFFEPNDPALLKQPGVHIDWLATMWALTFAIHRLELSVVMTDWSITNCPGTISPGQLDNQQASVIHYCFGDEEFDKRDFMDESGAISRVWKCSCSSHTVNDLIVNAIRETADFFSLSCR